MPFINRKHKVKERNVKYVHHNNISHQYYNTVQWHNLRDRYIKEHPFCEECAKDNIITIAQEVHHKYEFLNGNTDEERTNLLLDEDNLMSVCRKCHRKIHNERHKKDETRNK